MEEDYNIGTPIDLFLKIADLWKSGKWNTIGKNKVVDWREEIINNPELNSLIYGKQ